jgi:hypothetical protein
MKRLVVMAALAAGSILVQPLEAAAQQYEPGMKGGTLICGYWPYASWVALTNTNNASRSLCRWKCVYRLPSGQLHVNAGARNVAPGEFIGMGTTSKDASNIAARVSGAGSCVEAKPGR